VAERNTSVLPDAGPVRSVGVRADVGDRWTDLGRFIREQRNTARLSLRHLSELAGVSDPYLSQIERGLRRPSAEILQQIARGLRISAETLYVQAGILDPPTGTSDLRRHIMADPHLSEDQKQVLARVYLSFRRERGASPDERPPVKRAARAEDGSGGGASAGAEGSEPVRASPSPSGRAATRH
jgi:transcriptional regulator with XRE-family HTH domain